MVGGARPAVTQSLPFPCSYQNGRSVSKRGVSCQFGPDVTKAFLEENQLDYIIRSHEVKSEGYEVAHGGRCVTVFSAPNYWCVLPSHPLPVWIMYVWLLKPGLTIHSPDWCQTHGISVASLSSGRITGITTVAGLGFNFPHVKPLP